MILEIKGHYLCLLFWVRTAVVKSILQLLFYLYTLPLKRLLQPERSGFFRYNVNALPVYYSSSPIGMHAVLRVHVVLLHTWFKKYATL